MAKKDSGSGCLVIGAVIFGVIAAVPREVWVVLGVGALIAVAVYFWVKNKSDESTPTAIVESGKVIRNARVAASEGRDISKAVTAESCWRMPGNAVEVSGYTLPDGAIYLGEGLASISGHDIEPALINLKLQVRIPAEAAELPGYWPSYSRLSPQERGTYLRWLVGGRRDPSIDIGYVFLFFYGLERRLLADSATDGHVERELPWVRAEVTRLISVYGDASRSFNGYASGFLDFLSLSDISGDATADEDSVLQLVEGGGLTLALRIGLGRMAADGRQIPADWAYLWVMADERVRLRTPALRCEHEFKELFIARYGEVYGAGLKVAPPKTRLKATYRPASASFGGRILECRFDDIPDILVAEAPVRRLSELVDQVTDQLAPYSRFLAREPSKAGSIAALLMLPPTLWPDEYVTRLGQWLGEIGADQTAQAVRFGELIRYFPDWEDVNKEKMGAFSMALESLGVGMEPDVRWGGPMPDEGDPVVLFPLEKDERMFAATAMYRAAALTLRLAAVVSASDGGTSVEEEAHLTNQISLWPNLSPLERKRLGAFLKWLLLSKPSLTGLKRQAKDFDEVQKRGLASFLIHVAQAEGSVSPRELKSLGKIYRLLGLDENDLYSHAHAAATEPVTVKPAQSGERRYVIPGRPDPAAASSANKLDMARIEELKKESEQVSKLLAGIFAEPLPEAVESVEEETVQAAGPFRSLDAEYASFAQVLIGRPQWTRSELEDLAEDRALMLDGVMERINEAVFDQFNEPLFEGDDPIEINPQVLKELSAG